MVSNKSASYIFTYSNKYFKIIFEIEK